jgi:undecaprenyl-diphosphatase
MQFLNNFDARLTKLIRELPEKYQPVMSGLSFIGEPLVVLSVAFAGFISAVGRHQTAVERAFAYGAIAFAINIVLKLLLHRGRPHGLIINTLGLRSYSFPSGHAFGTVIFYGLFAYLDLKYLSRPWNALIAGLLTLVIILIGVSRVYLGSHYPSDVAAGWLLGIISLSIIIALAF